MFLRVGLFVVSDVTAPYAEGVCHISVQLDAWSGDSDKESPFWMDILGMTDAAGNSLQGAENSGWGQCGAKYPCWADSLLEDRLFMRPILAPDSSVPYIQFDLGAQAWSTREDSLNDDMMPGCRLTPCLLCDNPVSWDYTCDYGCTYGGGKSSLDG
ncbi:hypothetical protein AC578_4763 [Pseudocercospora eumusae]|uniref:Uncharacterized protein n=1 Tax=Pseudocercospora eumusae TaxID=321146 RepID=A0A139HL41_9PEZI|nr:hypothetical protein AC578_4763 [Pseudocercospora eumusae]KXT03220.1 hypothetical protein AC578_4763 [Pseudocercospora eumusae]KXT03221.1 hypothetical protein AC578_4763 [Pseudocercospora eumusae]